jgi:hypothetical protein
MPEESAVDIDELRARRLVAAAIGAGRGVYGPGACSRSRTPASIASANTIRIWRPRIVPGNPSRSGMPTDAADGNGVPVSRFGDGRCSPHAPFVRQ